VILFIRKSNRRRAADTAIRQLDALDARRDALRPAAKIPAANKASPSSTVPPQTLN